MVFRGSQESVEGRKSKTKRRSRIFGLGAPGLSKFEKQIQFQNQRKLSYKKLLKMTKSADEMIKDPSKTIISKPSNPSDNQSIDSPILKNQAISGNIRTIHQKTGGVPGEPTSNKKSFGDKEVLPKFMHSTSSLKVS